MTISTLAASLMHRSRLPLRPSPTTRPPLPFDYRRHCDNDNDDDDDDDRGGEARPRRRPHRPSVVFSAAGRRPPPAASPSRASAASASASSIRQYHSTARNEILPFLAAGVLGASAVYTYRAFRQMDRDWEEYYRDLEEYRAVAGIDPEERADGNATGNSGDAAADDLSRFFKGGTLAIDVGTTRLKLSHRPSLADESRHKDGKPPPPSVSVDREGFRSTPSLVWVPPSDDGGGMLVGRLAEARSHDAKGGSVVRPREMLERDGELAEAAIQQSIRAVAANALDQVLGGSGGSPSPQNRNPLFVLDESLSSGGSYNVRPVFTYPPHPEESSRVLQRYQRSVNGLTSPAGIADFVPEPVAVVTGAEYYNLLPPKSASAGNSVLVIDVGGASTSVSVVGGDDAAEVLCCASFPFGGDTLVDLLVSHLANGFFGPPGDGGDDVDEAANPSPRPTLGDPAALQRLHEASVTAVHELSSKTRSEINIPYLTMDLETRQPKHLEVGVSRNVVDAEVESWVRDKLVPYLQDSDDDHSTTLSPALPPPTNLSTLLSSAIMSSLERTSLTPHALRAVLLVGGGARAPSVRAAAKESLAYLGGDEKRLIMPEGGMAEELGVLGAAIWGSGGR